MEQNIFECPDCNEIFSDGVDHTCWGKDNVHFTSYEDRGNKQVSILDEGTGQCYESSTSQDATYNQLLAPNERKIIIPTERSTSIRMQEEKKPVVISSQPNGAFSVSPSAHIVYLQREDSREGWSVPESKKRKKNLNASPILQDVGYPHCTEQDVSNLETMSNNLLENIQPSISFANIDASVEPLNVRNLVEHCDPLEFAAYRRPEDRQFVCPVCGRINPKKSNFLVHFQTHTGERPFSCDICDYKCVRKFDLEKHRLTHTKEKQYKCSFCEKILQLSELSRQTSKKCP